MKTNVSRPRLNGKRLLVQAGQVLNDQFAFQWRVVVVVGGARGQLAGVFFVPRASPESCQAGGMSLSPSVSPLRSSDGELYAGVYVDFMGTDSAVFRTLGTKTAMRTDQYNSRWLNGICAENPCVAS